MKTRINKEYLISLNFTHITEDGKVYLRKDYVAIPLFNKQNEIVDLVDISIYLVEKGRQWIIGKCISFDSDCIDVFKKHFKGAEIKELLYFDMVNNK